MGRKLTFRLALKVSVRARCAGVEVPDSSQEDLVLGRAASRPWLFARVLPGHRGAMSIRAWARSPDRPAREKGDPVLRDDHVEGFLVGELVGVVVNRDAGCSTRPCGCGWAGQDGAPPRGEGRPGEELRTAPAPAVTFPLPT